MSGYLPVAVTVENIFAFVGAGFDISDAFKDDKGGFNIEEWKKSIPYGKWVVIFTEQTLLFDTDPSDPDTIYYDGKFLDDDGKANPYIIRFSDGRGNLLTEKKWKEVEQSDKNIVCNQNGNADMVLSEFVHSTHINPLIATKDVNYSDYSGSVYACCPKGTKYDGMLCINENLPIQKRTTLQTYDWICKKQGVDYKAVLTETDGSLGSQIAASRDPFSCVKYDPFEIGTYLYKSRLSNPLYNYENFN